MAMHSTRNFRLMTHAYDNANDLLTMSPGGITSATAATKEGNNRRLSLFTVELQEAYLRQGILGRRWEDDAMHVAMATLSRVDVIASWNFKHMVDPRVIV